MDISQFFEDLILIDGIWYSRTNSAISYPEDGNINCFEIEEDSFWFRHRNNCIAELAKRYAIENIIFDVGGGNGFVSKALENLGFETVLVEPGIKGIVNAKKRNLKNLICATLENGNFRNNSLPNVGLFDVIEHIDNDLSFLNQVHNYLKPGGSIFITVPAYNFLWSDEDIDAGHKRRYTIKSLNQRLETAGFTITYKTYLFLFLPLPIFLFRTLTSKFGLNRKSNNLNKHKQEHSDKGLLNKVFNFIFDLELKLIRGNKRIPFGGSCLIVGTKV